MKQRLLFTILAFSMLLSCAPKSDIPEVQFWNFGGTPNFMRWIRARVDSFNTANPDFRVVVSQKSWNMIRELLYTNFSAGTGPDVMTVHANYAAEFGAAGHFFPIDTFPDFDRVKSWYLPSLIEATRYKERYYGLPSSALAFVLVCNKDLFDAEGLAPPRTWAEFRTTAKKLTKDNNGDGVIDQWGLVLLGGDKGGFSYRLAPFMLKAGVRFLSDDLTRVEFNSPEAVASVKLFADMFQIDRSITPGFLAYTLSEINDLFCSNKVAMSIEGPWFRSMVDDKSPGKGFYTVPVPAPQKRLAERDSAPTLQDMVMFAINARSAHVNEAWRFVKSVRDERADMHWVTQNLGGLPTTLAGLDSAEAAGYPAIAVYRAELQHARPWPPHPQIIPIVRNVLAPYGQKAIIGELTPQQAMEMAAKEAQEIIGERK